MITYLGPLVTCEVRGVSSVVVPGAMQTEISSVQVWKEDEADCLSFPPSFLLPLL